MRAAETGGKTLLITAYGDRYFRSLGNRLTGYKDVTLLEMLTHLSQGWGEHQATEIMDLQGQLTRPWSTDENILDYIEETKKIYKHLEHAKCTYVLTLKVTALLSAFERSGELVEACRKWQEDEPPETDEDLKNFTAYFLKAYQNVMKYRGQQERRTGHLPAKPTHGYGNANAVEQSANAVSTVVEGLDNLAAVVTMDRDRTADLVTTNKTLVEQVAILTAQNGKLINAVAARAGSAPPAAAGKPTAAANDPWSDASWDKSGNGYCWSHGHKVKKGHTSVTCTQRCPHHRTDATKGTKEDPHCQLFGSNVNFGWEDWTWQTRKGKKGGT